MKTFLNQIKNYTKMPNNSQEKTNIYKDMLKNPKYAIFYKGKEVRRYAFYRQAKAFCIKHNSRMFSEDRCEIINLETSECINSLFE